MDNYNGLMQCPQNRVPHNNELIKSSKGLFLFSLLSMSILLIIRQDEVIEQGSLTYYLIILPAVLLPFITRPQRLAFNVFFKVWPILLMLIIVMAWGLFQNDIHRAFRLALFLLVISWIETSHLFIKVKTLSYIYITAIVVSVFIFSFSGINHWGIIPGTTDPDYGVWRVSFFPNIANTGFISLFIFMILTKDKETLTRNKLAALLSLYFILFSFVRSAIISLVVYIALNYIFRQIKSRTTLFMCSILAAFFLNFVVGYAGLIIESLQSIPIISRLFLRGEHDLSQHDIYVQMYRPWIWKHQWYIFTNSPYWMGEGLYNFNNYISSSLRGENYEETDSISFLLGLLASYGVSALLFYYYILKKNYINATNLDAWACAIFPIIIFIGMQWGSIFHPACVTFLLFFLALVRGRKAFI